VWALDFQFDETADQRRLELLNIVDEFTREALTMRVGRSCDADQVVAAIEALVAKRGTPAICAWTTVPSSSPGRSRTGAG
jgi:putative transposase